MFIGGCRQIVGVAIGAILIFACGVIFSAPVREFVDRIFQGGAIVQIQQAGTAKASIEGLFRIGIPTSTSNHYFANRNNTSYWIRFSLPPRDMNGLFAGSPFMTCNFPLIDSYRPQFAFKGGRESDQPAGTEWWDVGSIAQFIGGECTGAGPRTFRIMVNTSDQSIWTLYLEVIEG